MSSAILTEPRTSRERKPVSPEDEARRRETFQPWHLFLLLSMAAATVVVVRAQDTHPVALLLLSAAAMASGLVAWAVFRALTGFLGVRGAERPRPLAAQDETALQREKALALRAIKELEFDRAMGKISEADFKEIGANLRRRALSLMEELERPAARAAVAQEESPIAVGAPAAAPAAGLSCASCSTRNDADARFCKTCGARL
jgi:hypothetical protein